MVPEDEHYAKPELVADVRHLAERLETAHPDPYEGHGGRVDFHRRVEATVRAIPDDGESVAEFYPRVAELVAGVRDGHTDISPPEDDDVGGRLPLGFRVVGDELYVDEVYADRHGDLLGGRIVSVEDVPTDELFERIRWLEGSDNVYQDRVSLALALRDVAPLRHLVGHPVHEPTLRIETADGATTARTLAPTEREEPTATLERSIEPPETDGAPAYRFLDEEGSTALLVLPDMFSYREAAELLRGIGHEQAAEVARDTHERLVDVPTPDDLDAVVADLPSAVEILTELVTEMAAADTEHLVVDTRANTGGNSLLSNLLTYVLYGWEGIATTGADHVRVPKDSPLYRECIDDEDRIGETDNPAGFDFESYFQRDEQRRLEELRDWLTGSRTVASEFEAGTYEAYHQPESVTVVTAAMTYSAGAEPAFTLSKLDADVVGVPPSQAPNVPRDTLTDELPNTGLQFRTAYRHVESRPDVDGRVLPLTTVLTPDRFEAMGRPADAGIRLALDDSPCVD